MDKREMLVQYSIAHSGDWTKITQAIRSKESIVLRNVMTPYITIFDDAYPDSLRLLRYPPWVLFYKGNIDLLKTRCMTIVGSRELNAYGKEMTCLAADILSRKYTIVSGLAKGADAFAHQTALKNHSHTIGVIASGLKTQYPSCNAPLYKEMEKHDLIITEYPFYTGIRKHHFACRNRILAALGEKCIVTGAKRKSGTMLTVNEAMALSKEVWCFPYPFGSEEGEGCSKLINDGAFLLYERRQLSEM